MRSPKWPLVCTVYDCERTTYARGLCEMHYRRKLRHGDTHRLVASTPSACSIEGCEKVAEARGWCHGHYQRWLRKGSVDEADPLTRRKQPATCKVEDCDRPTDARGLCTAHHDRLMQHGEVFPHRPIRKVNGTGFVSHGYRYVPVPKELRSLTNSETSALEHRFVMALQLGRALMPDESVHHRNGDRLDNRIENLELWSRWQPKGQRVVGKVAYAIEILGRYQPELLDE